MGAQSERPHPGEYRGRARAFAEVLRIMESTSQQASSPLRTCDIVMKGGITSGVVYPLAIFRLSRRFVFKNIGGTSAGAIAAAATAAAEFCRQRNGNLAGFEKLALLPKLLIQKPQASTRTRLFQFF